jgi:uncharacterized membrane protein
VCVQIFRWIIAVIHALSSAAWFGAMFYSLTTLHPRARAYFREDSELEEFIATVAQGARWKVLLAFALMGISGVLLAFLSNWSQTEWYFIAIKSLLWLIALLIFSYGSWSLWPRRIFATPAEVPSFRARFRAIAMSLIIIAAGAIALGVALEM